MVYIGPTSLGKNRNANCSALCSFLFPIANLLDRTIHFSLHVLCNPPILTFGRGGIHKQSSKRGDTRVDAVGPNLFAFSLSLDTSPNPPNTVRAPLYALSPNVLDLLEPSLSPYRLAVITTITTIAKLLDPILSTLRSTFYLTLVSSRRSHLPLCIDPLSNYCSHASRDLSLVAISFAISLSTTRHYPFLPRPPPSPHLLMEQE
jgi:hypothetical protein